MCVFFKDGDSNLKAAEAKLKAKEKEEAKSSSVEKAIKDNISADEKKKKQLQKVCTLSITPFTPFNCFVFRR